MAAPSYQDLYDYGRYVLQARRPTMVVNPGDVSDSIIAGMATCVDVGIGEAAGRFRSTYLDGAEGDDLTAEASDRGTDRIAGVEAIGAVTLARLSFAAGAGTIPAGYTVGSEQDSSGAFSTYTTDTAAVFGPTDLTKTVNVTCTLTGTQGNVGAGKVTRMLGGTPFDPSITVSNSAIFVGGGPEESDPDLRDRAKSEFVNRAKGTEAAVIKGAKTVKQVRRVSAILDEDTGVVTLYVADADGNSNSAMVDAVRAAMPDWAPIDAIVNVVGADLLIVAIDISLTVRSNVDPAQIIDKVRAAIVSRLALLNPGETLHRETISGVRDSVDKQNIVLLRVNTPAADIVPSANQVIRTTTSSISTS